MLEIDSETIERVARWCAQAGRQATAPEIRRALAPLSWDELLLARALLADPPPARPLGPSALADIARGAPPEVAAERERGGRYAIACDLTAPTERPPDDAAVPARRRPARGPGVVIRRARDRTPPAAVPAPGLPPIGELRRPEGRALLERLFRRFGARRALLSAELARGWRSDDGSAVTERDLDALLDHHGLARAFARRERDEVLHALRACGGVRLAAASRLGLDRAGLDAALSRLGASEAAERIRDERRAELRRRATLAERVRLLLVDEPRLQDLGLLPEWEEDLRRRLPEHVRALRAGRTALAPALAKSLAVTVEEGAALATRFGLAIEERERPGPRPPPPGSAAPRPRRRPTGAAGRPRARPAGRRRRPARGR